jgi:hypothetical protein
MTPRDAYRTLHTTLSAERDMREFLFRGQPARLKLKLAEIDDALTALEWLRQAAGLPEPATEPKQDGAQ